MLNHFFSCMSQVMLALAGRNEDSQVERYSSRCSTEYDSYKRIISLSNYIQVNYLIQLLTLI